MPSEAPQRRRAPIGELVAVAGLIVAGLSLYLAWSGRREDADQRRAEQTEARRAANAQRSHIGLVATDADGESLSFKGTACPLQSADIRFPSALKVPPQTALLAYRIEADWFDGPLLTALEGSKAGQGRLPVLIDSRCSAADGDRAEHAIYEIPYRVDSRLLRGKSVRLRGLVLREHVTPATAQARLDAAWRALAPAR